MERPPERVLAAYGFETASIQPITHGLINRTYRVETADGRYVLQQLHPIFEGAVNRDIDAITAHLAEQGLPTPRLVRSRDGALYVEEDGAVFRTLSFLEGRVVQRVTDPELAREAGALVGRFHVALRDFEHEFQFVRSGVHDLEAHLDTLRRALTDCRGQAVYDEVAPVGAAILEHAERLPSQVELPQRIVHGDLKISNVLFEPDGDRAIALIDLDTLGHGTIRTELGDALRSWCNRAGEDEPRATFDPRVFDAAVDGYAKSAAAMLEPGEIASIVIGFETLAIELAARFCADALLDSYFGWNPARFESRSAHNLVRARGQQSLAQAVCEARDRLQIVVRRAFERAS